MASPLVVALEEYKDRIDYKNIVSDSGSDTKDIYIR